MENTLFDTQAYKELENLAFKMYCDQHNSSTPIDRQEFIITFKAGYHAGYMQCGLDHGIINKDYFGSDKQLVPIVPFNKTHCFYEWLMNASTDDIINWLETAKPIIV